MKLLIFNLLMVSMFSAQAIDLVDKLDGSSTYQLFFFRSLNRKFDPKEDILKNPVDNSLSDVKNIFLSSALKLSAPLAGLGSRNNNDIISSIQSTALAISNEISKVAVNKIGDREVQYLAYMLPWNTSSRDTYLSREKISIKDNQEINPFELTPNNKKFFEKAEKNIKDLQVHLTGNKDFPFFLLGTKLRLSVTKDQKLLTADILLGLNEKIINLEEPIKNDQVNIGKVIVPNGTIVRLKLYVDLEKPEETSRLITSFGNDIQFKESQENIQNAKIGNFLISKKNKKDKMPRMIASPIFKGKDLSPLVLEFGFSTINFDLTKAQTSDVNILLSFGFGRKNKEYTFGTFSIESVNEQLAGEMNATISALMAEQKDKVSSIYNQIFSGVSNE